VLVHVRYRRVHRSLEFVYWKIEPVPLSSIYLAG
jgi:hypothetical protein